jgi:hypothetical protein
MLTRIGAGTASSFKPGQTGASGGGAASTVGGVGASNAVLYAAVIAGVAGLGLASAAFITTHSGSSSPTSSQ